MDPPVSYVGYVNVGTSILNHRIWLKFPLFSAFNFTEHFCFIAMQLFLFSAVTSVPKSDASPVHFLQFLGKRPKFETSSDWDVWNEKVT